MVHANTSTSAIDIIARNPGYNIYGYNIYAIPGYNIYGYNFYAIPGYNIYASAK